MRDGITTNGLGLVSFFVDKNNPKFELNGALLDKENKNIVATNTIALIVYHMNDLEADGILHKSAIDLALKTATAKQEKDVAFYNRHGDMYKLHGRNIIDIQTTICEETENRKVNNKREGAIISMPEIVGKFPDYFRIMPKAVQTEETDLVRLEFDIARLGIMVDRQYLVPLMKYIEHEDAEATIMLHYTNRTNPIMIEVGNVRLTIMPIIL